MVSENLEALVIEKRFRVPAPAGPAGDGEAAARQFDVVLMSAGFKCSGELLAHLSGLDSAAVIDVAVRVLATVRRLAGSHVQHNAYFKDFPSGVPDTVRFWTRCLREALLDPVAAGQVEGIIDLEQHRVRRRPRVGDMINEYRWSHDVDEILGTHRPCRGRSADTAAAGQVRCGDYRAGDGLYAGYTPRPARLIIVPERVTVPAPRLFYVAPAGGAPRSRCPARTRRAGQRRPAREYPAEPAPTGLSWWPSMTLGSSRVCCESDGTVMRPGQPVARQSPCPRHRALWPGSGAAVRGPSG